MTVRFLYPTFHGRGEGGEPEWPPSPLRLFQALVASAARLQPTGMDERTRAAFRWLEQCVAPLIIAPAVRSTVGMRLSVPNNAMDVVARAWCRGNDSEKGDADPRTHRAMKTVRPYWLHGDRLRYVWRSEEPLHAESARSIVRAARHLTCLGWGIDQVVGDASLAVNVDPPSAGEEEWQPFGRASAYGLRTPTPGTFEDLEEHHRAFLNRIGSDGFSVVPPLSAYRLFAYRRASEVARRPVALFALTQPVATGSRDAAFRAFDPARKGLTVAGMLRHATAESAEASGWPAGKVAGFVLGHAARSGETHTPVGIERFAYLPLPSIEFRGNGARTVGSIRRAAIASFAEDTEPEISWAKRMMPGRELFDEDTGEALAMLTVLPDDEKAARPYLASASSWCSVTPVVLPGYDDPEHLKRKASRSDVATQRRRLLERVALRTERLIRKALLQFGMPEVLANHADVEWRNVGFLAGVGHVNRYGIPSHLRRFPRYHVRITFRDSTGRPVRVRGPLCIGGGRYAGLGLFVADE